MDLSYNAKKNAANIAAHGLALSDAALFDFDGALEEIQTEEGEERVKAISVWNHEFIAVVVFVELEMAALTSSARAARNAWRSNTMSDKKPEAKYVTVGGRRFDLPSAEEDAKLHAAALADPDNPPLTGEQLARMKPAKKRGRPTKAEPKVLLTLRLDPDVIAYFKKTGDGWHTRINSALREHMGPTKITNAKRATSKS